MLALSSFWPSASWIGVPCRPGFFAPYAIPTYPALLTLTVNRPEGSAMNENAPCSNDRKD